MKLLSENQIYDISMSRGQAVCPISFAKGMEESQKLLLESASEGFSEWWSKERGPIVEVHESKHIPVTEHQLFTWEKEVWQASRVSMIKLTSECDVILASSKIDSLADLIKKHGILQKENHEMREALESSHKRENELKEHSNE